MCFFTLTIFACAHQGVSIHHSCPAAITTATESKLCILRPSTYGPATADNTVCSRLTYDDAFCAACAQGLPEAEGTAYFRHGAVQWDAKAQQEGTLRQISDWIGEKYQGLRKDFQRLGLIYHRLKVSTREGARVTAETAALCQEVFGGSKCLPLDPKGNTREDWFSIWRQVEDCRKEAEPLIVNGEFDMAYGYLASAIEALGKIKANLNVLADHVECVKSLHDSDVHSRDIVASETPEQAELRKQLLANWLLTLPEIRMNAKWRHSIGNWSIFLAATDVFGAERAVKAICLDYDQDPDTDYEDEEDEGCDLALDDGEQYGLPNGRANSTFPVYAPPSFGQ